ncbi:cache domain-containing protein [Hyalangium rubrum]|uniref:Cache domain-containing protein n=1 Tax=Hyalangium rubrum TaxID=3103134 RepID=A0ABU5HHR7_9BACT|nr:cache domain-containing protein [Hyalangium sp. s54d21]MDY7232378.1 cache domain-containing protein [Hyalangium sp. s54d21]
MKKWGAFLVLTLGALLALGYGYESYERRTLQGELDRMRKSSHLAIQSVDDSLHRLMVLSEQVARMDRAALSREEVSSRLCDMMRAEPRLKQLGYALDPTTTPDHQRFAPYCVRKDGKLSPASLEDDPSYDYTTRSPETEWYHRAKSEGEGWSEPYYDPMTRAILAEHTRPLSAEGGFAGVAFANYSLKTLTDLVKNLDLGRGGYAFVMTRQGRLLSHPNWTDVVKGRTLQQLASTHDSAELEQISQWVQTPGAGSLSLRIEDPMTQGPAWAWCEALSKTGWAMCTVTVAGSALHGEKGLAKWRLAIVFSVMLFALIGLAMLLKVEQRQQCSLWILSTASTALLCGAVGYTWHLAHKGSLGEAQVPAIISASEVDRLIQENRSRLQEVHRRDDLVVVPTGIHVSQISSSDKTLSLTGIVWQSYRQEARGDAPTGAPVTAKAAGGAQGMTVLAAAREEAPQETADALPPSVGVDFPGALSVEMEELFRKEVEGNQVIGWSFQLELPEKFDARDFPLDRESIKIDMVPRAFDAPVILVPDLSAYDNIITSALPGVGNAIGLPGWQLEESFFSHVERVINSDLGLRQADLFRDVLTLRFTISARRVFTNPVIGHVLPLVILLFLMFAVLMLSSRREGLMERLGFNASTIIGAYGTFFFIAVLQHVSLRESMGTAQLVYFEWFYILVYVLLLLLSLNALLFSTNSEVGFVLYEDNLWPKLMYGPLTAGGALAATCVWFY